MGFWSAVSDFASSAVESGVLTDVVTGAAIGAGIAWMADENPWAGAAIGAIGGGVSSGTSYDISDFLFGEEVSAPTDTVEDTVVDEAVSGIAGGAVKKSVQGELSRSGGLMGYLRTPSGGKVAAATVAGVGGYLAKQEEMKQKAAQKEKEMRLAKDLNRISISKGRKKIAPWASEK